MRPNWKCNSVFPTSAGFTRVYNLTSTLPFNMECESSIQVRDGVRHDIHHHRDAIDILLSKSCAGAA